MLCAVDTLRVFVDECDRMSLVISQGVLLDGGRLPHAIQPGLADE